jgi:hypothetical protein
MSVAMGIAGPSRAASEDVDTIVKHGVELRKQGKDREALAELQRAASIDRGPRVLGQLGLAEMAVGLWVPAADHLEEALGQAQDPWIAKNRAVLDGALKTIESHVGTVDVWGTPAGAEVLLDGAVTGTLPLAKPARAVAGSVAVTVRAKGHQSVVRTIQVVAGQLSRESVNLVPVLPPEMTAAGPHGTPPPAIIETKPSAPASRPLVKQWWFWTAVGAIVAVGAVVSLSVVGRGGTESPPCPAGAICPGR